VSSGAAGSTGRAGGRTGRKMTEADEAALRGKLEAIRGFTVCARRCDECLFTADRIVGGEAVAAIIQQCVTNDTYFSCHKFPAAEEDDDAPPGRHTPVSVCCRGFFDTHYTRPIQMARRMGLVRFVDEAAELVDPTDANYEGAESGVEVFRTGS
jgi:hypothetical protein